MLLLYGFLLEGVVLSLGGYTHHITAELGAHSYLPPVLNSVMASLQIPPLIFELARAASNPDPPRAGVGRLGYILEGNLF